ncbi:WhiB family transcriptional regulator [Kineococcus sp. NBC_00420]|uniref:WhiB family transcriptional regulator n=1 Tax=Kineococcus sp. NBC_00420 TaxID=2903564 RepID=UPI003FA60C1B
MNEWRHRAACRDFVELFDETFDSTRRAHPRALQICDACPVRRACLDEALSVESVTSRRHGLLGGLMPVQRERFSRRGV